MNIALTSNLIIVLAVIILNVITVIGVRQKAGKQLDWGYCS